MIIYKSSIPTDAHCADEMLWVGLVDGRHFCVPPA